MSSSWVPLLGIVLLLSSSLPVRCQTSGSVSDNKLLCMAEMVTNIEQR